MRLLDAAATAGRDALTLRAFTSGSGAFLIVEGETAEEAANALNEVAQTAVDRKTARGFIAELPSLDMGCDELKACYRSFQHSRNTT
jgi:4-diphosphocytidyl-2C-methyl-D-erythritol kinase